MYHARHRAGRRPWRSLLCIAASLAAVLTLCSFAGPAIADCTTGGSTCLPNNGYTDDEVWNCGAIAEPTNCYFNGTTSSGSATSRYWGWGSASYGGAGTSYVCMQGGGYFYACADNLARGCFYASCDAQASISFLMWVENHTGTHTVSGHGKI